MTANVIGAIECFVVAGIAVWACRPRDDERREIDRMARRDRKAQR